MKACVLLAIGLTACATAAAQVPCKNHYILAEPCRVDVLRTWRWESAGAMSTPRRSHAATLLEDGRVLVVGGIGESDSTTIPNYLANAEIYDPATNRWSPVPDMTIRRALPVTIRLRDGRVLATGDIGTWQEDFVITGIAEAYDPATGRWSGAGRMITPRVGHTMTLLDDGTVLVAGGLDQYDMPVGAEIYDPVANRWEIAPPMRTLRFAHTATRLPDGSVLVAGGSDDDYYGAAIAGAERYDPVQRKWLDASQLSAARYSHTATLLPDGEVLVVGGYNHVPSRDSRSSTTYYTPTSFAVADRFGRSGWSVEAPLNFARTQHAAAPLPGRHGAGERRRSLDRWGDELFSDRLRHGRSLRPRDRFLVDGPGQQREPKQSHGDGARGRARAHRRGRGPRHAAIQLRAARQRRDLRAAEDAHVDGLRAAAALAAGQSFAQPLTLFGYVGALRCFVACSKAYARAISFASLHAAPTNEIPHGKPCTNPAGTVMCG
jgi:hypothetical protein